MLEVAMSRLLLLFKFRNPIVQEAIRRSLRMRFHRYALVDFFLNLVAPLKVYARPECITGISRFKLHFSFRGRIYVAPAHSLYMASKGALTAFAKGAALDLANKKIRVNTIAPGMVNTPLINYANIDEEQRATDIA